MASRSTDFLGINTVWHDPDEHGVRRKYFTRAWVGRLRFHVFFTGDPARDHHDHPWRFFTFPFTSYVEEVFDPETRTTRLQIVKAWRLHFRPADHSHKVLGKWSGERKTFTLVGRDRPHTLRTLHDVPVPTVGEGPIITLVWSGNNQDRERAWGFWRNDGKNVCWMPWKRYVDGGKHQPCE